jgi:hypothetical protein
MSAAAANCDGENTGPARSIVGATATSGWSGARLWVLP